MQIQSLMEGYHILVRSLHVDYIFLIDYGGTRMKGNTISIKIKIPAVHTMRVHTIEDNE